MEISRDAGSIPAASTEPGFATHLEQSPLEQSGGLFVCGRSRNVLEANILWLVSSAEKDFSGYFQVK